jgi:energy-coupling factor transporter transmembrane protein EcfT
MILGIIILLLVVGVMILLMRVKAFKHKFVWFILMVVIIILFFGYWMALAGKDIDYNSLDGLKTAGGLYLGWFANGFNNIKVLTTNAIALDWRDTDSINENEQTQKIEQALKKVIQPVSNSTNSKTTSNPISGAAVKSTVTTSSNTPVRK